MKRRKSRRIRKKKFVLLILMINLMLGDKVLNVVIVYTSHMGCDKN